MANLPSCRLQPYTLPFLYASCDYFGPIKARVGRSKMAKHYGVIFTCLNTRAVHCELATDLTTMEFLQCTCPLILVCLNLKLERIPVLIGPYFSTYSYLCENDQEKAAIWCITDIEYAQKESRNGQTSGKTGSISAFEQLEYQYM